MKKWIKPSADYFFKKFSYEEKRKIRKRIKKKMFKGEKEKKREE